MKSEEEIKKKRQELKDLFNATDEFAVEVECWERINTLNWVLNKTSIEF